MVRLTAVEYLALVDAVNLLESYADDDPAGYGRDYRAAERALAKVRNGLTPAVQREVVRQALRTLGQ